MRKLLCELTKGIALSSAARSKSNNCAERTVTKIWMPASLLDLASTLRPGQCLRSSRTPQCTKLVHDPFNYMTRESHSRETLIFHRCLLRGILSKRTRALDKQYSFSCIIAVGRSLLSLAHSLDQPSDRPNERTNEREGNAS